MVGPQRNVLYFRRTANTKPLQAQTLEQRRRNAKFAKDQDARRGKSETEIKKRTKDVQKSPISPFWLGILGFIVFGGLIFELLSRIFFR
ncbi:hypothetical protein K445DRAFT_57908 [Daldinia sp. EC12]|nr:hypothetical protein F4774DRAFT_412129 [Daldinia eschscholtzii]OTB16871.1 hypothetical protein K445DRAFT_57908 [Daldinia sp. EC12]